MTRSRPGRLQRLDASLVPRIAAVFRVAAAGFAELGRATGPFGRGVKWLFGRHALVTTAGIAVVVAVVLIVVSGGGRHHSDAPTAQSPQTALPGNQLGPTTGESVHRYTVQAAARRSELTASKATQVTAVVDFDSYLTPPTVKSLLNGLAGVHATLAYAKAADVSQASVHSILLGGATGLAAELSKIAATDRQLIAGYQQLAARARQRPTAANLRAVANAKSAVKAARAETNLVGPDIGCVFAATVTGPPAQLTKLAGRPDVRVLDPAPAGVASSDLAVIPLEPEVTGQVPVIVFDRASAGG